MLKKEGFGFAPIAGLVLVVLVGTLMPGSVKSAVEDQLWRPVPWSQMAHFCSFALLAWMVAQGEGVRMFGAALLLAAVLAATTEFLQQWVPGRHPRLLDVAIDMSGAMFGCVLTATMQWRAQAKGRSTANAADRP